MKQLAEITFNFTETAEAAGLGAKGLRNWLDRGLVQLDADKQRRGEGWRRFSIRDVVRLAVTRTLAKHGLSVPEAFRIAAEAISRGDLVLTDKNLPYTAFWKVFVNATFMVWHSSESFKCLDRNGWLFHQIAKEDLPEMATTLPGLIIINVYVIVGLVLAKLGLLEPRDTQTPIVHK